jgi:hypothetical protein
MNKAERTAAAQKAMGPSPDLMGKPFKNWLAIHKSPQLPPSTLVVS